jgi:hypothetical protein
VDERPRLRDLNGVVQSPGFEPSRPFTGCHNFGIAWHSSDGSVSFYYDSALVWTHSFNGPYPEFLIFNHATAANRITTPGDLAVDWVRVWSQG